MVESFSCPSFYSKGVMGLLSGLKDERVVIQQRQGIGHQLVQLGIAVLQRRLRIARRELLPQEIGNVIDSKGTGDKRLLEGSRHGFRAVLLDQLEKFSGSGG